MTDLTPEREQHLGRDTSAADVDGAEQSLGHHESVGERQGRQPAPDTIREVLMLALAATHVESSEYELIHRAVSDLSALRRELAFERCRADENYETWRRLQLRVDAVTDLSTEREKAIRSWLNDANLLDSMMPASMGRDLLAVLAAERARAEKAIREADGMARAPYGEFMGMRERMEAAEARNRRREAVDMAARTLDQYAYVPDSPYETVGVDRAVVLIITLERLREALRRLDAGEDMDTAARAALDTEQT